MSAEERLSFLLKHYTEGTCSNQEFNELFALVQKDANKDQLFSGLKQLWNNTSSAPVKQEQEWNELYLAMMDKHAGSDLKIIRRRKILWRSAAAAAVVFVVSAIGLLYNFSIQAGRSGHRSAMISPIVPGGNKAVLTLADGSKVILDGKSKTILSGRQRGVGVEATGAQLVYAKGDLNTAPGELAANRIETPRGGQYQVVLSDGTKVWLNSMSSLKYPVVFQGRERRVELSGEAYFEVAKNKNAPFKVLTAKQQVQVLGTHFNIKSYADEPLRTTLLEGKVEVQSYISKSAIVLSPGEQAELKSNRIEVRQIDTEMAVAWKKGTFMFEKENMESVLKQVSKWYDVEIIYQNEQVKKHLFSGSISRFEEVTQVLDILQLTGFVHFKIEGRRIIVMS